MSVRLVRIIADIAVAGLRIVRSDTDGNQVRAGLSDLQTLADRADKGGSGAYQMIGRKNHHKGIFILPADVHGTEADAGSRVASDRLTQNILFRKSGQLSQYQLAVSLVGGNVYVFQINQSGNTLDRELNHGLPIIGQREKLLRKCLTAPRPESLSTASGHDQSGCFHIISSPLIEILCRVKTE